MDSAYLLMNDVFSIPASCRCAWSPAELSTCRLWSHHLVRLCTVGGHLCKMMVHCLVFSTAGARWWKYQFEFLVYLGIELVVPRQSLIRITICCMDRRSVVLVSFCPWHHEWCADAHLLAVADAVVWLISMSSSFASWSAFLCPGVTLWARIHSSEGLFSYFWILAVGPYSSCYSPGGWEQRGHLRERLIDKGCKMYELWR